MNILIFFPTELEAKAFEAPNVDANIVVKTSGVGVYNTIFSLIKPCLIQPIDLVILAGIAGSYSPELPIGEVVQVVEDSFADIGVWEENSFKDIYDMGLEKKPNTRGVSQNFGLKQVIGVTVNTITSTELQKTEMLRKYSPQVESMEGAAATFVCNKLDVPCLQLRAVSNYVTDRNKNNWNIPLAIENLHKAIESVIFSIV